MSLSFSYYHLNEAMYKQPQTHLKRRMGEQDTTSVVALIAHQQLLVEVTRYWHSSETLRRIGERIGYQLAALVAEEHGGSTAESSLDAVKLVARDVCAKAFARSVDSLKTNHRGTFHLKLNALPWAPRLPSQSLDSSAEPFLLLASGLVHGALLLLGFPCDVRSSVEHLTRTDTSDSDILADGPPIVIRATSSALR
jgi:hypothetical protein